MSRPRHFDEDQVLQKALTVFWSRGYEATGITELEHATGLGRQSLYNVFGDKKAFFVRVVDCYVERFLRPSFIDVLEAPGSPRENLERLFSSWEGYASTPDFHGCLLGNSIPEFHGREDAMEEVLRTKLLLLEQALASTLQRAVRAGELDKKLDVAGTARTLLTLVSGLCSVARVHKDHAFARTVMTCARKLLI